MSSPAAKCRRTWDDAGSGWASLPKDLLVTVASRLLAGDLLHYVRLRAVCTGWRSGTTSPRGRGVTDRRFHPRRWMMLPEGHCLHPGHPDLRGYIRFLNLDTGALVRVRIPLFRDHCAVDSVDGLLLMLRDPDEEGAVRLLNPFTGDVAELPPFRNLGSLLPDCPATYRNRRVARDAHHQVLRIDPPVQDRVGAGRQLQLQPPKLIATIPASKLVYPNGLVECGSEILVLGHNDMPESQILVYKLTDLVLQRFIPTKDIGGNTLFLDERNISVSSKVLSTVKGDNVVFRRWDSRQCYLAQYHLSSGSLSPAIDDCRLYGRAPGPSSLVHYIFSCCIRNRWSRGIILREEESWFVQNQAKFNNEA